jgi:hypothetical protein
MLGYVIPIMRTRRGSTLIIAGTTALTGGLLLIGYRRRIPRCAD